MEQKIEVLLLSQKEVIEAGVMDFDKAIEDVEKAYSMLDKGQGEEPVCPQIWIKDPEVGANLFAFHPGSLAGDVDVIGIKAITRFPKNPSRFGIPLRNGMIELMERNSGKPITLMDAEIITNLRTGCATAVGAKYLARKDSRVAGLLGAGAVQYMQIVALSKVMKNLELVKIYDIYPEKAETFTKELAEKMSFEIKAVPSAEEAVRDSDIVAPATLVTLDQRYIKPEWIKQGSFLANLSDNDYTFDAIKKADRIVIDGHKQFHIPVVIGEMVKKGMLKPEDTDTIGSVINQKVPGRQSDEEIIFYSTLGMGVLDIIIAKRIYDKAKELGIGQVWTIWDKNVSPASLIAKGLSYA